MRSGRPGKKAGAGMGTVLTHYPMLKGRRPGYYAPQPRRMFIYGHVTPPALPRLLREREKGEVVLFTTPFAKRGMIDFFEKEGCRVIVVPSRRRILDLRVVLQELHRLEVTSVLGEGGRQIHTTLLASGLADKVVAFLAPKIVGGWALRNPVEGLDIPSMEEALVLQEVRTQTFGNDICLEGYLRRI